VRTRTVEIPFSTFFRRWCRPHFVPPPPQNSTGKASLRRFLQQIGPYEAVPPAAADAPAGSFSFYRFFPF
jgi:hypothetical protein